MNPPAHPGSDFVVTPEGRKHYVRATSGDVVFSILLPGWGILIGLFALCKSEGKRGTTMISVGALALLIYTGLRFVLR